MTKPERWASSQFLWSFMKLVLQLEKHVLSYLHKFKMAAHDFHLVRLCTATC